MKLTEKDKKMFDSIKQNEIGKWLADYCERVQAHMCDCRYWDGDVDKEAGKLASDKIDKLIIGKLKNINKKGSLPSFK